MGPPAPEAQRLLNEIRRQPRASPLKAPAPERQPLEATTVHLRSRGASPLALAVHLDRAQHGDVHTADARPRPQRNQALCNPADTRAIPA
jgi:hypothetical protein